MDNKPYIILHIMLALLPLWPPPFLAILRYSVLVLYTFEFSVFLRGLRLASTEQKMAFP